MVDTRPFLGCCIPAVAPDMGGRCKAAVIAGCSMAGHLIHYHVFPDGSASPLPSCPSGWLVAGLAGQSLDLYQRGRVGPVAGKIAAEGQGSRMARARHVQKYWYLFFCFHIWHIVDIVG